MNIRPLLALLASTLFAGCAAPPEAPVTTEHPAHPAAAEAPVAAASGTLALPNRSDSPEHGESPAATATTVASPPHQHHVVNGGAALYTCPHHPEVTSAAPGDCPKCGMKLEPKAAPAAGANTPTQPDPAHGTSHQHDHGGHQ